MKGGVGGLPGAGVIVFAGGVDVQDLAPENLLRRADVADALEKLLEVSVGALHLEALVVEDKALDQILPKSLGGPATELSPTMRLDSVANTDNDVEVEVLDQTLDRTGAFNLN